MNIKREEQPLFGHLVQGDNSKDAPSQSLIQGTKSTFNNDYEKCFQFCFKKFYFLSIKNTKNIYQNQRQMDSKNSSKSDAKRELKVFSKV